MLLKRILPFTLTLIVGLSLTSLPGFGGSLLSGGIPVKSEQSESSHQRKVHCASGRINGAVAAEDADDVTGAEVEWMRYELQQELEGRYDGSGCIPSHMLSTRTRLRLLREQMRSTTLQARAEQAERAWAEAERFAQARARRKAASR